MRTKYNQLIQRICKKRVQFRNWVRSLFEIKKEIVVLPADVSSDEYKLQLIRAMQLLEKGYLVIIRRERVKKLCDVCSLKKDIYEVLSKYQTE